MLNLQRMFIKMLFNIIIKPNKVYTIKIQLFLIYNPNRIFKLFTFRFLKFYYKTELY